KIWALSLLPSLQGGTHTFTVSVSGFGARRSFQFMPVRVDVAADGRNLYDNDFVAADATLEIKVSTGAGTTSGDLSVRLDDAPYPVIFEPDSSQTQWTGDVALGPLGLLAGAHELEVSVLGSSTARHFRISEALDLLDVSVFPNPFSGSTYFFYTLTEEAREATLSIFTVSGRRVFSAAVGTFSGYNQYRWDGRDDVGDRVANGAYIYKLVVKSGGREREAVGRVAKLD
ncbi:MAG TPA: FlgD immunoglobulin-like domain containing protein, partial [bacterium]|nr:FlgD immunoglobulin-like domain containing protein [bacterium]